MDFIDEEDVALFEIGQECREIARLGNHRSGGGLEVDAELLCHDLGQRGLAETGRPHEQHMVECLATVLGRLDKHLEIGARLRLAGEIVQRLRTHGGVDIFTALFGGDQPCRIAHVRSSIPGSLRAAFLSNVYVATQPLTLLLSDTIASEKSAFVFRHMSMALPIAS